MWERYKRTFKVTQCVVFGMALAIYLFTGNAIVPAIMFFVMMQGFALIGAAWATRLKNMVDRRATADRLPLQARAHTLKA